MGRVLGGKSGEGEGCEWENGELWGGLRLEKGEGLGGLGKGWEWGRVEGWETWGGLRLEKGKWLRVGKWGRLIRLGEGKGDG